MSNLPILIFLPVAVSKVDILEYETSGLPEMIEGGEKVAYQLAQVPLSIRFTASSQLPTVKSL